MQRTALFGRHQDLGARLIEFGGWEMPVQYTGIIEEHRAVRSAAGLFDLSHMGELWVSGSAAAAGLAYALVTDPTTLVVGRAHYSMVCTPQGGVIDDLIVYRPRETTFLVVANASNAPTVSAELRERLAGFDATLDDASLRTALIALQGPAAQAILAPLTDVDLGALRYYAIAEGHVLNVPGWVARTGYTGEDGFECFVAWDDAVAVWDGLLAAGTLAGTVPVGLGARDTLRLEAGMPLYGNELDRDTTPFDAGLGRVVKFAKQGDFVGRAALQSDADRGRAKALVGLVVRGRGIARHGYPLYRAGSGDPIGTVTSGTQSPTLGVPIAMGYVPPDDAGTGTMLEVGIRDARVAAEVVPLPFYTRPA
jgi:aminomethyltransferase